MMEDGGFNPYWSPIVPVKLQNNEEASPESVRQKINVRQHALQSTTLTPKKESDHFKDPNAVLSQPGKSTAKQNAHSGTQDYAGSQEQDSTTVGVSKHWVTQTPKVKDSSSYRDEGLPDDLDPFTYYAS